MVAFAGRLLALIAKIALASCSVAQDARVGSGCVLVAWIHRRPLQPSACPHRWGLLLVLAVATVALPVAVGAADAAAKGSPRRRQEQRRRSSPQTTVPPGCALDLRAALPRKRLNASHWTCAGTPWPRGQSGIRGAGAWEDRLDGGQLRCRCSFIETTS